jgi:hypothetical protein
MVDNNDEHDDKDDDKDDDDKDDERVNAKDSDCSPWPGLRMKRLSRGHSDCADVLLDWLEKGCADAISKGYVRLIGTDQGSNHILFMQLKSIVLAICAPSSNQDEPGIALETYSFTLEYGSQSAPTIHSELESSHSQSTVHLQGLNDTGRMERAMVVVVRKLVMFLQTVPVQSVTHSFFLLNFFHNFLCIVFAIACGPSNGSKVP